MVDTTRIGQSILPQQYGMSEAPIEMTPVTGDVSASGLSALLNGQNGMPQLGQAQGDEEVKQAGVVWPWVVSTAVAACRHFFIGASYLWFNTEGWRASQYEALAEHYDKYGDLKEARLNYEKAMADYASAGNGSKSREMLMETSIIFAKESAAEKNWSGAVGWIDAAYKLLKDKDGLDHKLTKIITARNAILVAEAKSLPDEERAKAIELLRDVVGGNSFATREVFAWFSAQTRTGSAEEILRALARLRVAVGYIPAIDKEAAELLVSKLRAEAIAQLVKGEQQSAILLYRELETLLQLKGAAGDGELRHVREVLYSELRSLAVKQLSDGNVHGAELILDDAIAVAGRFSADLPEETIVAKARMQVEVAERMLSADGPYDEAVRMLNEAYNSWPPASYDLGDRRDSLDLTAQAKKLLAEALEKDGSYRFHAGDFAAAEAQYSKATSLVSDVTEQARLLRLAGGCCRAKMKGTAVVDELTTLLDRASSYYLKAYEISRHPNDLNDFAFLRTQHATFEKDSIGADAALSSLDMVGRMLDSANAHNDRELHDTILEHLRMECVVLAKYPEKVTEERLANIRRRLDRLGELYPSSVADVRDKLEGLELEIPERLLREWLRVSTSMRRDGGHWAFLKRVLREHPGFEASPAFNTSRFEGFSIALRDMRAALTRHAPGKIK